MNYMEDVLNTFEKLKQLQDYYSKIDVLPEKHLLNENNNRLKILSPLINIPEEYCDEKGNFIGKDDISGMWKSLYRHETKRDEFSRDTWVIEFIDDVISATSIPEYASSNNNDGEKILKDLLEHTEALINIYRNNCCDDRVIINTGEPFDAMSENMIQPPKVSIIEILEFYCNDLGRDLELHLEDVSEKDDGWVMARVFINKLGRRNRYRYGKELQAVIRTAVWCIYKRHYQKASISKVLKKVKVKKVAKQT